MVDTAQALIAAGDIYQTNLTFPASVATQGDPLALYARLRNTSEAGWGGVIYTGRRWILSASPELFFTVADGRIVARPMKGTARRGSDRQRSEEHTSEHQSLMRTSYAVFCLKKQYQNTSHICLFCHFHVFQRPI